MFEVVIKSGELCLDLESFQSGQVECNGYAVSPNYFTGVTGVLAQCLLFWEKKKKKESTSGIEEAARRGLSAGPAIGRGASPRASEPPKTKGARKGARGLEGGKRKEGVAGRKSYHSSGFLTSIVIARDWD